jgi:hypothetical protein
VEPLDIPEKVDFPVKVVFPVIQDLVYPDLAAQVDSLERSENQDIRESQDIAETLLLVIAVCLGSLE